MLYLEHGDANTKLFHLQACHRSRKNAIQSLKIDGHTIVDNAAMADELEDHFGQLLGTPASREAVLRLDELNLPSLNLVAIDACFSEEEI